jgi:succinate dehydrogenase/fumarate reductase cytochrome b subunit
MAVGAVVGTFTSLVALPLTYNELTNKKSSWFTSLCYFIFVFIFCFYLFNSNLLFLELNNK